MHGALSKIQAIMNPIKNNHTREAPVLNHGLNQEGKTSRKTTRAPLTTEDTKNEDKLDKLEGIGNYEETWSPAWDRERIQCSEELA